MPAGKGRPRGSGETLQIPAVDLTFTEAVPFRAGYRLGPLASEKWTDEGWLHQNVAAYLNATERRAMFAADLVVFMRWVMVGIMQWHTDQVIRKTRAS